MDADKRGYGKPDRRISCSPVHVVVGSITWKVGRSSAQHCRLAPPHNPLHMLRALRALRGKKALEPIIHHEGYEERHERA